MKPFFNLQITFVFPAFIALMVSLALASCSGSNNVDSDLDGVAADDSGNSASRDIAAKEDDSGIVGLWDASTEEVNNTTDVSYVDITSSGQITMYDFAGDSSDDAGNCYWVDTGTITHISGDTYRIKADRSDLDVTLQRNGNTLTVNFKEKDAEIYTLTSNRSINEFQAEC